MKIQPLYEHGSTTPTSLRAFLRIVFLASAVSATFATTAFALQTDSSEIRAGYDIAVTTCVACHIVSPDQSIQPIDGPTVPSFQEIAKRPNVTLDSVANSPKTCSRPTALYLPHCSPVDHISDREWRQVAAYILSLQPPR